MPGHTNLYRRKGGSYYFLRRIPTALLPAFVGANGKQQKFIKVALGTKDHVEARRLVRGVSAEVQSRLDTAARELQGRPTAQTAVPVASLSQGALRAIVARWLHAQERAAFEWHRSSGVPPDSPEADAFVEGMVFELSPDENQLSATVEQVMSENDLAPSHGTPQQSLLWGLVESAVIEHARREIDRAQGQAISRSHDPQFVDITAYDPPPQAELERGVTFDQLLDTWEAERRPPGRTVLEWRRIVSRFREHVGQAEPTRITKRDIVSWKGALIQAGKHEKTAANHIAVVRALYNFAVGNDLLSTNPAAGIPMPSKPQKRGGGRQPYQDREAKKILLAARELKGYRRWIPWLLAYTGARMEEVAQALPSDVYQEDGVWCLHICDGPGKSLKNPGSERKVPLHPALIAEGFLHYLNSVAKRPLLFPELSADKFGRKGSKCTKWYGRWQRKQLGISDPRLVAHSWRHRFKDLCRRARIEAAVHNALTGHATPGVGSGYGLGYDLPTLAAAMTQIPDQLLMSQD